MRRKMFNATYGWNWNVWKDHGLFIVQSNVQVSDIKISFVSGDKLFLKVGPDPRVANPRRHEGKPRHRPSAPRPDLSLPPSPEFMSVKPRLWAMTAAAGSSSLARGGVLLWRRRHGLR